FAVLEVEGDRQFVETGRAQSFRELDCGLGPMWSDDCSAFMGTDRRLVEMGEEPSSLEAHQIHDQELLTPLIGERSHRGTLLAPFHIEEKLWLWRHRAHDRDGPRQKVGPDRTRDLAGSTEPLSRRQSRPRR